MIPRGQVTKAGFEDIIRVLPPSSLHRRGERASSGALHAANAREEETAWATRHHRPPATTPRTPCTGSAATALREGDLVLVDARRRSRLLYAAGITRTAVSGRFTEVRPRVHQAVLSTPARAAPGPRQPTRLPLQGRARRRVWKVIAAARLYRVGHPLPNTEESLASTGPPSTTAGCHARHHLGLDVHDAARRLQSARL